MTPATIRLHLFFARAASLAVILRQGPSKMFRMILWHTDTDRFEDGQWLKHKVYPENCAISPDGRHFLYFALNGYWASETKGTYTALCRPPYFTALALFPVGDTWAGCGEFIDNHRFVAVGGANILGRPEGMERVYRVAPSTEVATGIVRADGSRAPLSRDVKARLLEGDDWKPPLDRYDTLGGKLYHRRGEELELIRDFTDMEFEEIVAPYDGRGTPEALRPWHPLDGDTK